MTPDDAGFDAGGDDAGGSDVAFEDTAPEDAGTATDDATPDGGTDAAPEGCSCTAPGRADASRWGKNGTPPEERKFLQGPQARRFELSKAVRIFFELYSRGHLVWTSADLNDVPPQLTFLPSGYKHGFPTDVPSRKIGRAPEADVHRRQIQYLSIG